jgi:hypothetical protein
MLAQAVRNTRPENYPVAVKVPEKKHTLPTRADSSARRSALKSNKD